MRLINISELICCDYETFEALHDAFSISNEDFNAQGSIAVSQSFLKSFPPSRAQECLSGFWDYFDKDGRGQSFGLPYTRSGVNVIWHDSRAWIRAINSDVSLTSVAAVIRRTCEKYLPIVVSWNGANHDFTSGSIIGGCIKITKDSIEHMNTWAQMESWLRDLPMAYQEPRPQPSDSDTDGLIRRIRANALRSRPKSTDGKVVIYIPEPLSPLEREKLYGQPLTLVFKDIPHTCVEGGTSWLSVPGGSERELVGCEIVISTGDVEAACALLREKLPGGNIPVGSQVQYRTGRGLVYDEWDGCGWRVRERDCHLRIEGKCVSQMEAVR